MNDHDSIAVWRPLREPGAADAAGVDRRTLLRAAVLLGVSLSSPAVLGILAGRTAHASTAAPSRLLGDERFALVAEVAEIMIPSTDTPGARDVGVPAFIDDMLANVYAADDQQRFLAGLAAFQSEVRERTGREFLDLAPEQRREEVQRAHDHALAGGAPADERPFMLMTKELALLGFFTSREGATQVLQYAADPGAWLACQPLDEAGNGRTWATDKPLPF